MNKVLLITGASSGLGKSASIHMAQRGWNVYGGVRTVEDAQSLRAYHDRIHPLQLDVTNEEQIYQSIEKILEEQGHIDALVNNAGITLSGPIEALDLKDWKSVFDVNFFEAVCLTQKALPWLRRSQGRIINVSSVSGRLAFPFLGGYSASKFALEGYSDALRREISPFGVKVIIIEPGPVKTPIWSKGFQNNQRLSNSYNPEIMNVYGPSLTQLRKLIEKTAEKAKPMDQVIETIEKALTLKNPNPRYVVSHNRLLFNLFQFLPDPTLDKLILMARR